MTPDLLDQLSTAVITLDAEATMTYANPAAVELLGPSLAGNSLVGLFPQLAWHKVIELCNVAPHSFSLTRAGRLFSATFTRVADGCIVAELRELADDVHDPDPTQTRRMVAALEHSGEAVVITDRNARIVYVNPEFERVMGYSRAEVIGGHNSMWRSGAHDADFYEQAWQRLQRGETWRGELINRRRDGSLVHEQTTISRVVDRQGEVLGYAQIKRDVTEQRELEQRVAHAQRMDSIGTLAGGIAHDFNNVLQTILGNAEAILARHTDESELTQMVTQIGQAAEQSASLTHQLLVFARKQVVAPRSLDPNLEIARCADMLRRLLGAGIELHWQPGAAIWPIRIDPAQLSQVITNICINARDAIEDVGTIHVSTSNVTAREASELAIDQAALGDFVRIELRDSGRGIDARDLARVFEPFFTTKEVGQGTGLGLATVYGIVTQNRGHVLASSTVGAGTTMSIYLPRCAEQPQQSAAAAPATVGRRAGRVLVVEDEAAIRTLVQRMLEMSGYEVLACADGAEALREVAAQPAFDLVIADVIMPGMNGRDLVAAIVAQYPQIATLFMSGYTADVLEDLSEQQRQTGFIHKPFRQSELLARVEGLLAG